MIGRIWEIPSRVKLHRIISGGCVTIGNYKYTQFQAGVGRPNVVESCTLEAYAVKLYYRQCFGVVYEFHNNNAVSWRSVTRRFENKTGYKLRHSSHHFSKWPWCPAHNFNVALAALPTGLDALPKTCIPRPVGLP